MCYRYFPSKEVLFDSAIDQYADILVAQFAELAESSDIPLKEFIEKMPATVEDKNTKYYAVFHGPQNKKFHNQLSLKTSEKLVPIVEKLLQKAKEKGEIQLEDLSTAADVLRLWAAWYFTGRRYGSERKSKSDSGVSNLCAASLKYPLLSLVGVFQRLDNE